MVDDFLRRRIKGPVVVGFHPNSNPITRHILLISNVLASGELPEGSI
jgi:hypothetical protein